MPAANALAPPAATRPRTSTPSRSYTAAAPIGGRLGPRRTTSSRENTTRTVRPRRSARARAAAGTGDDSFPPNAPPLASGVDGSPPGSHHDASGSRYAGSTQLVARRTPAGGRSGSGNGARSSIVVRRPWTFPASARASASVSATTQRRPAASTALAVDPVGQGTATRASRGATSSAKPPPPRGTSMPTRCRPPPSSSARRAAASRSARGPGPRRDAAASITSDAAASIASYTVCQPVHRHRCAASPRSTSTRRVRPFASNDAARITIPGVQNPHCEPPVPTNAPAMQSRVAESSPSTVVTARPSTRAAGVTQATRASPSMSTVQQPHWPCGAHPSLADTSPSRSRSTDSNDSPGATSTSTGAPLHTKPTRSDITFSERQDRGMPPVPLSRRAFLAASGGLLLAAACGGSGGGGSSANGKGLSALLLASDLYASPNPQRIAFALAEGPKSASGPPANLPF